MWSLLLPTYFGNVNVKASSVIASPPPPNSEDDVNYLQSKAVEAMGQGMYEEALAYLDRALEIEPFHVGALIGKAGALSN
jgi:hypothetical protein